MCAVQHKNGDAGRQLRTQRDAFIQMRHEAVTVTFCRQRRPDLVGADGGFAGLLPKQAIVAANGCQADREERTGVCAACRFIVGCSKTWWFCRTLV